jgi:CheY-like chemotaxis protein
MFNVVNRTQSKSRILGSSGGPRSHRAASRARRREDSNGKKTLLWIDDYQPGLTAYKTIFEACGYSVLTASSGRNGLRMLKSGPDAVVVDYEMPEMNGGEVAREIRRRRRDLPIIMFSGSTSIPRDVKHLVSAFCDKASPPALLMSAIEHAVAPAAHPPH